MSGKPDPASFFMVNAPDRLALIDMRGDAEDALAFCRELHGYRGDIHIAPRYDIEATEPRQGRPMQARFPGRCTACATNIRVGEPIYYDAESRTAVHQRCG